MSEVPPSLGSSLQWRTAQPVLESPPPNWLPISQGDSSCSPMAASLEMSPVTTGCAPKWKPTKSLFVKSFLRRIGSSSGNKDSLPNLETVGTKNNNGDCSKDSYENNVVVSRKEEKTSVQDMHKANVEENPIMETKDDLDGSLVTALGAFTICSPAPNITTSNLRPASPPNCTSDESPSSINILSLASLSSLTIQDTSSSPASLLPKKNGNQLEGLHMSDEKVCLIQESCKEQCKGDTSLSRNAEDSHTSFAVQFNGQEEDGVSPLLKSGDIGGLLDISRDDSLLDGSEETSSVWLAARRSSQAEERTGLVRKLELLSHR